MTEFPKTLLLLALSSVFWAMFQVALKWEKKGIKPSPISVELPPWVGSGIGLFDRMMLFQNSSFEAWSASFPKKNYENNQPIQIPDP